MYDYFNNIIDLAPEEVLIYLRKSRSDDPLLSVEDVLSKHEQILDDYSEKYLNIHVPESNRFREVVSGETIADRPEVQKVLKLIESPRIRAILVVEVQRLSRGDLEDAGRLIKLLRYTNTIVITQTKTYDLKNEYDRDIFERELKRGNEFLEYQKKIMNRGRLLSVQQGNFIGSIAPYGYDKTVVVVDKKKCHTLKINEAEADVVRMIFDMYVNEDMGRVNICHRLNALGIKPRKNNLWSQDVIKIILENEHYIGKVRWNWRKVVNIVEDGEICKSRPKNKTGDYMLYDGKHEAIISEELFNAAKEKQGKNHRAKPNTKIRNPLSGLLYCQCGRTMSLRTYTKNGVQRSAPRLLCDNQCYCKTSSCLYDEVVDRVAATLEDCIRNFEILIENESKNNRELHESLIQKLKNQYAELNKRELQQWEKYSSEGMPKHIFDALNEKVLREKEEVQQALEEAYRTAPNIEHYERQLTKFQDALDALNNSETSAAKKNKLLKVCIERMDYNRPKTQRITSDMAGGKGILKAGGSWTDTPIELNVKLRL